MRARSQVHVRLLREPAATARPPLRREAPLAAQPDLTLRGAAQREARAGGDPGPRLRAGGERKPAARVQARGLSSSAAHRVCARGRRGSGWTETRVVPHLLPSDRGLETRSLRELRRRTHSAAASALGHPLRRRLSAALPRLWQRAGQGHRRAVLRGLPLHPLILQLPAGQCAHCQQHRGLPAGEPVSVRCHDQTLAHERHLHHTRLWRECLQLVCCLHRRSVRCR
mmetsp:Transcript_35832/g.89909  ORF Transcript_35832/g.89909 Transcript_35832/m.89909 type:complete len:226 (-) Transcript_35832:1098-1775(-)